MQHIKSTLTTITIAFFALFLNTQATLAAEPTLEADVIAMSQTATETVDINSADANTLADMLHGVGPAKAKAIVEFREAYGPFAAPEEITAVKGIGPATYEKNADKIATLQ